jgi:molybdopterin-guanine dinucleotide biosynthesis protein A
MPLDLSHLTLAILAGGEGSRMGKPKGELWIHGTPILSYLLDRFQWPGPTLLVTAPGREHPPGWESFSREVVDPVAGQGPLRGVLTALEASQTSAVLVATVDMPEVGPEQLKWLVAAWDGWNYPWGIMAHRRGDPNRIEPFPCIVHAAAADLIRERLRMGEPSVRSLARLPSFGLLECPVQWPDRVWTNLNRPEDFAAWQGRTGG